MIKGGNYMLSKVEIFKDIQSVIKTDYAGYVDKRNINHPEKYHVDNNMSDREFVETIRDYILDFNDGHMWFIGKNYSLPNIGFKVRRFENSLYVTECKQENRLQVGDEITKIDNVEISKIGEIYSKQLEESIFERQQWNLLLRKFSEVEVVRDNKSFKLLLSSYENEGYVSTHSAKQLDDKTMLLKVTDFAEEKPIVDLVRKNKDLIEKSENLIIDVRINNGGNDEFYFPLLNYIFEDNIEFKDLFTEDEAMYTNYTKRNCDLWLSVLEEYLEQELEDDTIKSLQNDIEDIKEHYGKGFEEVPEETEYLICGQAKPENIYILTDYYCGSSGETFVSNAKKSMKVITVGRPTMGIMDYFNLVTVDYGDFEFDYSISKMHENSFTYGMGIQPDYYIPWTPEHLEEDKDLLYVQKLIKEKEKRKG